MFFDVCDIIFEKKIVLHIPLQNTAKDVSDEIPRNQT